MISYELNKKTLGLDVNTQKPFVIAQAVTPTDPGNKAGVTAVAPGTTLPSSSGKSSMPTPISTEGLILAVAILLAMLVMLITQGIRYFQVNAECRRLKAKLGIE